MAENTILSTRDTDAGVLQPFLSHHLPVGTVTRTVTADAPARMSPVPAAVNPSTICM